MARLNLFDKKHITGIFRGSQNGGLEFHADIVLPYRSDFQSIPMHGQFLLVQLENPNEAVLGRIASFSADGKLSSGSGEEFNIRAVREERAVPEDLREQYLKYRLNIRVLGLIRIVDDKFTFVPSHRRLPHVGSPVAFPSGEVLREITGHNGIGAQIGNLAFGEYIYADGDKKFEAYDWMQILHPEVKVRFPIESLVSRRSFIFARAGFGKSNLNKLLFSLLYENTPTVQKRDGKKIPVGTVIFDPDGEYFWPDDKGRPGLCDVPQLEDKLVVFTSRKSISPFYQSFVAGGIKLDVRRLRPSDVIAIALGPERQDQQNVRKLRSLSQDRWMTLVDLIDANGNSAPILDIAQLLDLEMPRSEAEAVAARSNMTAIVRMLHDRSSQLMDLLIHALSHGKLCVVDVSQMRGGQALVLSGLILRRIFDRNQAEFTSEDPKTIPTIAVVEEAQSVLNDSAPASEPYVAWVKEGRKYDLGALLITQQPSSIPSEILSQGDNWFVFHLLSAGDLGSLKKANAHFSDDLLSSLLNEPIPGQGVFWSSVGGRAYPISMRARSFEQMYSPRDPGYKHPPGKTFARELHNIQVKPSVDKTLSVQAANTDEAIPMLSLDDHEEISGESFDALSDIKARAIESLRLDEALIEKIRSTKGVAWGQLKAFFLKKMPQHFDDREQVAYLLVKEAMDKIFEKSWEPYKHDGKTYVRSK